MLTFRLQSQEVNKCYQFVTAFDYVENNIITNDFLKEKSIKITIDTTVHTWPGVLFMIDEYNAYKMDISLEEYEMLDNEIKDKIYWENQDRLLKIDSTYSIDCFKDFNHQRPNVMVRFTRVDNNVLSVWIRKIRKNPKKHSYGKYLIMFFDIDKKIEKVIETNWVE